MKKTLVSILFVFACAYAQVMVPMTKTNEFAMVHSYCVNNKLYLLYTESSSLSTKQVLKCIVLDLSTDKYETSDIFNEEFYKTNKQSAGWDGIKYQDEYVIQSTTKPGDNRKFFVHNLVTGEAFQFDIGLEKGNYVSICYFIRNKTDKGDEFIIFTKESQQNYFNMGNTEDTYKITRFDLVGKELSSTTFDSKTADFTISDIFIMNDARHCLIEYKKKGTGYAMLNFETMELAPVPIQSEYNYIKGHSQIAVNGGIIFSLLMGDLNFTREDYQLGISYEDGTVKELKKEKYDFNGDISWMDKPDQTFYINNEVYQSFFNKKKLVISGLKLNEISRVEYEMNGAMDQLDITAVNDHHIELYCDNSSQMGGKKLYITANLDGSGIDIKELDKKYKPEFENYPYLHNGTTRFIYYKWDEQGLVISKNHEE